MVSCGCSHEGALDLIRRVFGTAAARVCATTGCRRRNVPIRSSIFLAMVATDGNDCQNAVEADEVVTRRPAGRPRRPRHCLDLDNGSVAGGAYCSAAGIAGRGSISCGTNSSPPPLGRICTVLVVMSHVRSCLRRSGLCKCCALRQSCASKPSRTNTDASIPIDLEDCCASAPIRRVIECRRHSSESTKPRPLLTGDFPRQRHVYRLRRHPFVPVHHRDAADHQRITDDLLSHAETWVEADDKARRLRPLWSGPSTRHGRGR